MTHEELEVPATWRCERFALEAITAERWHILQPFTPEEAVTSARAAARAGVTQRTIVNWCEAHGLGRQIAGRWRVSRCALEMFLEGNAAALRLYLAGNRDDQCVTAYFARLGVPLKRNNQHNR